MMEHNAADFFATATTWLLSDGKPGHENQSLGVAEALGCTNIHTLRQQRRFAGDILAFFNPGYMLRNLPQPPWPQVVIATGRLSTAAAWWIKVHSPQTFVIVMMRPFVGREIFDVQAVPMHDKPVASSNLITTLGAPNRLGNATLLQQARAVWEGTFSTLPNPKIAVLLGGSSRRIKFDAARLDAFAAGMIKHCRTHRVTPLITVSRRTDEALKIRFQNHLQQAELPNYFWDGSGDNPYLGLLACAQSAYVSADSVSMVSEAASAGLPVYVHGRDWPLGKFHTFYNRLNAAGYSVFSESGQTLQPPGYPLNDTARVAAFAFSRYVQQVPEHGAHIL